MKNIYKVSVCYILALCICVGLHAQTDTVFSTPYPQRYQAVNDFILAGTDSALDIRKVSVLLKKAEEGGYEQDILNVARAELVVKQMWRVDTGHFMQRAEQLLRRADRANCHPVVAFVYQTLGDHYYEVHDYVQAFGYYLRAYELYHNLYKDQFPDMSETQLNLATAYYRFNDYQNSLRYSKELIGKLDSNRIWISIFINDLVGASYTKLGQHDSAIVYFQKALQYAPLYHSAEGIVAWKGISTGKIGNALYQQKKYDEAIPYLLKGVELCTKGDVPNNTATFAICLFYIYFQKNNLPLAEKYMSVARQAAYKAKQLENYIELYSAFTAYYRRRGDAVLTLQFQDSTIRYKDSLATILDVNKKYITELQVAEEGRSKSEKLAKEEKRRLELIRNELIIIAVLLMFFTLLFYNRKLLKQKYERQQALAEKQIAETELENAVQQLNSFRKNLDEKNELLAVLEKEIDVVHDATIITRLQKSTILTDEQWEDFRSLFEKAHPGFLQKLKEKLPGLSPAETRFMVLAKLNFTNKEMAATLGVSGQAIRTTWYRMRKKLNLPEEGTLDELVEKI